MPDPIPTDDLYARLGVARDADRAAIDRAWRALLKRHHPDVAGTASLEFAKQINVAHDWLADPGRRARYDDEVARRIRRAAVRRPARRGGDGGRPGDVGAAAGGRPRAARESPADRTDGLDEVFGATAPAVRAFLRWARTLSDDDRDRLAVSAPQPEPPSLRHFVPPELWSRVGTIDGLVLDHLPEAIAMDPVGLAAARAYAHALVLEPFVAQHFADPDRFLDSMRHGWEAAVGQARYGPNGREVRRLLAWLGRATAAAARAIAGAWVLAGSPVEPWPAGVAPDDYAALAVSAALARRDAAAAADRPELHRGGVDRESVRGAFRAAAHICALRPIFSGPEYAQLQAPFLRAGLGTRHRDPSPTVRRA